MDPDTGKVLTSVRAEGDDDLNIRIRLQNSTGWLKENWIAHPDDEAEAIRHIRIGSTYNSETGKFLRPKPHASWVINAEGTDWVAPVENTENAPEHMWNEETQSWWPLNP